MINFIINFFAIIGLIILISYFISYIIEYFKEQQLKAANKKIMPPTSYMQNSGIRCPDYLSNTNVTNNSYTCSNRDFNINVKDPGECYFDTENKLVNFKPLPEGKTWELGDPSGLKSMTEQEKWDFVREKIDGNPSRCDWIDKCGPAQGVEGIWQGVNKWCSMANPSDSSIKN